MRPLCLVLLGVFAAALSAQSGARESGNRDDPDRLYADRTNLASARRAADLWSAALRRDARDFDAAWKLSRADYWLGGHAPESERRQFMDSGVDAGRAAVASAPNRPEGHFWLAANMGAIAEANGLRAGLKYRKPIKDELDTLLRIDPSFMQGSADRVLGRWYFRVPTLLGGSRKLAEEHLRTSLKYNPNSTVSHFFLAELLVADRREADARTELQLALDAPFDPEWDPENQEYKQKARALLARLKR
jgi:tetratricopeptide (TPR) repeat protein